MAITLLQDGKEKTYSLGFVSGRMLRRTFEVQKKMKQLDEQSLDEAVDYVVDLYGKQFTRDEFYDGIDAGDMFKTIGNCLNEVTTRTAKAIGAEKADPN